MIESEQSRGNCKFPEMALFPRASKENRPDEVQGLRVPCSAHGKLAGGPWISPRSGRRGNIHSRHQSPGQSFALSVWSRILLFANADDVFPKPRRRFRSLQPSPI